MSPDFTAAPTAFVLLEHVGHGPLHHDLMIRRGDALATWRLDSLPDPAAPAPIRAERIGDHRLAYLDYEGPVSGGRGSVRRIDQGQAWLDAAVDEGWQVRFAGRRLCGDYSIVKNPEVSGSWLLRPR